MATSTSARSACARWRASNVHQWSWSCGFYPASHRGMHAKGTAKSFEAARAAVETAWHWLLTKVTQADFDEYRRYQAHEAWKHAMWEAGCKLPTEMADGRSRCFRGVEIKIAGTEQHIAAAHMAKQETV
jgi:hypothetical protein